MKSTLPTPKIVTPAQWLATRRELLNEEKEFIRLRDRLASRRRGLPWVRLDKAYVFDTARGPAALPDLFAGRSQLMVYHFMLGPGWEEGCKSCSWIADHFDAMTPHLAARDVTLIAVSRAPLAEILAFKSRMGWQFEWASSHRNDFNRDFHVSFTPEELASGKVHYNYGERDFPVEEAPGLSVFARDSKDSVFHTYSTYSRGLDPLIGTYNFLDLVPKGRDEEGLENPMEWVRHHDRYEPAAAGIA